MSTKLQRALTMALALVCIPSTQLFDGLQVGDTVEVTIRKPGA